MKEFILPNYTYLSCQDDMIPVISDINERKISTVFFKIISKTEQSVWKLLNDAAMKTEAKFFEIFGKAAIGKGFIIFKGNELSQTVQPYKLPITGELRFIGIFAVVFVNEFFNTVTYEKQHNISKEWMSTITDIREKDPT